jgi:hypothetical protein
MLSLIALQRTEFKIRPSKDDDDSTFAEKLVRALVCIYSSN